MSAFHWLAQKINMDNCIVTEFTWMWFQKINIFLACILFAYIEYVVLFYMVNYKYGIPQAHTLPEDPSIVTGS